MSPPAPPTPPQPNPSPIRPRLFVRCLVVVSLLVVLTACSGDSSTATLVESNTDIDSSSEDSLLGYSPFGCPVWDLGKVYEMDELTETTLSIPWCRDIGIVTTYCGISGDDIATRFAEDGEIISGGDTTIDNSHSISTYDTLLPGFPQAVFINVYAESHETLICPNGEALHITREHSTIFASVGGTTDLPPRSALVSPVTEPASGLAETSTTVDDGGSNPNNVECPRENVGYIEADQAALCLYEAWVAGDSGLASRYGTEEAIAWLGPQPDGFPDWEWHGCSQTGDAVFPVSCQWSARLLRPDGTVDEEMHGVMIEMLMGGGASAGFWVESIESYG